MRVTKWRHRGEKFGICLKDRGFSIKEWCVDERCLSNFGDTVFLVKNLYLIPIRHALFKNRHVSRHVKILITFKVVRFWWFYLYSMYIYICLGVLWMKQPWNISFLRFGSLFLTRHSTKRPKQARKFFFFCVEINKHGVFCWLHLCDLEIWMILQWESSDLEVWQRVEDGRISSVKKHRPQKLDFSWEKWKIISIFTNH